MFASSAAVITIGCQYTKNSVYGYACLIKQALLLSDTNETLSFTGSHMSGQGNVHVKFLSIDQSRVVVLSSQFFTTFPNLVRVETQNSGLERITTNNFEKAAFLKEILVSSKDLTTIEPRAFEKNPGLISIEIQNGKVKEISSETFVKLAKLETLSLVNLTIKAIPVNTFTDLVSLKNLVLRNNDFEFISGKLFQPLKSLVSLDLRWNKMQKLDGDWFLQNGANVKTIYFDNNKIAKISPDFISNLVKLEIIQMAGNICANRTVTKTGFPSNFTIEVHESLKACYKEYEEAPATTTEKIGDTTGGLESTEETKTSESSTASTSTTILSTTTPRTTESPPASKTTTLSTTTTNSTELPPESKATTLSTTTARTTESPPASETTSLSTTTARTTESPSTTEKPNLENARNFFLKFTGMFKIVDNKGTEIVKKNVEEGFHF